MTHVVHHLDADGHAVWTPADGLDAALALVERLQHEGVSGLQVFAEVPIRIETIYRVSVATADQAALPSASPAAAPRTDELAASLAAADEVVTEGVGVAPVVDDEPVADVTPDPVDTSDEDAILAAIGAVSDVEGDELPATPPPGSAFLDPPSSNGDADGARRGGLFGRG